MEEICLEQKEEEMESVMNRSDLYYPRIINGISSLSRTYEHIKINININGHFDSIAEY